MKLPKRINRSPLADVTLEIRFNSDLPSDAVFGLIYPVIRPFFSGDFERLPILQIPPAIRDQDPNLIFNPHFKISNQEYTCMIGPKSISFSSSEYKGWEEFSKLPLEIFSSLTAQSITKNIIRLGLRYVNFFSGSVFNQFDIDLKLAGRSVNQNQTALSSLLIEDGFNCMVQLNNNSVLERKTGVQKGTILDIDISKNFEKPVSQLQEQVIEAAHEKAKNMFFSVINEQKKKDLDPEY